MFYCKQLNHIRNTQWKHYSNTTAPAGNFPFGPRGASPTMMTWCISCMRRHKDGRPSLSGMIRINYLWITTPLERILRQGSFTSNVATPKSLPRYRLKIPNLIGRAACRLEIRRRSRLMTWRWKVKGLVLGHTHFLCIPFCLKIVKIEVWVGSRGWWGTRIGVKNERRVLRSTRGEEGEEEGGGGKEVVPPGFSISHSHYEGKLNTAEALGMYCNIEMVTTIIVHSRGTIFM